MSPDFKAALFAVVVVWVAFMVSIFAMSSALRAVYGAP